MNICLRSLIIVCMTLSLFSCKTSQNSELLGGARSPQPVPAPVYEEPKDLNLCSSYSSKSSKLKFAIEKTSADDEERADCMASAVKGIGKSTAFKILDGDLIVIAPRNWEEFERTIGLVSRNEGLDQVYLNVIDKYGDDNRRDLFGRGNNGNACANTAQEAGPVYTRVFRKIKEFAYSSRGLDYSESGATQFATRWMKKYSCNVVDKYISELKAHVLFAYSTSGLDKSRAQSAEWALKRGDRYCGGNYSAEFRKRYDFAYSRSGLNKSRSGSTEYGYAGLDKKYFSCSNRFR